jgi:hypothetical protein
VAELTGVCQRHARWRDPTEAETAAAVAELQEIVSGRDDGPALLAEVAGLMTGFHKGGHSEARAMAAARFCLEAGADEALVPKWVEEGRRRAAVARHPPFSGGVRPLGACVLLTAVFTSERIADAHQVSALT